MVTEIKDLMKLGVVVKQHPDSWALGPGPNIIEVFF